MRTPSLPPKTYGTDVTAHPGPAVPQGPSAAEVDATRTIANVNGTAVRVEVELFKNPAVRNSNGTFVSARVRVIGKQKDFGVPAGSLEIQAISLHRKGIGHPVARADFPMASAPRALKYDGAQDFLQNFVLPPEVAKQGGEFTAVVTVKLAGTKAAPFLVRANYEPVQDI